MLSESLKHQES